MFGIYSSYEMIGVGNLGVGTKKTRKEYFCKCEINTQKTFGVTIEALKFA